MPKMKDVCLTARVDGVECSFDSAAQAAKKVLGAKTLILVSPNCSVEQMIAIKALADTVGAKLSGYSDGYIKTGDGDDWLIRDDKSANRAGLALLGIDSTKETFTGALNSSDVLLSFNNDLFIYDTGSEFRQKVEKMKVIAIGTHDNALTKMAAIAIPVASYSESSGSVINSDGILQHFSRAVRKNTPLPDMIQIAGIAGSPIVTESDIASEMKKVLPSLTEVIPEGGLKLTESEAAHVPA